MTAEHLDLRAVSLPGSLVPPELETRPLDKRFDAQEKAILALQLFDLRYSFPECRLDNTEPLVLGEDAKFEEYPDYEFTLLVVQKEIERLLHESGSLHIVGRAQTAEEILSISNLLTLLRSHGRYAPATFITSYFPLQRGDRYQQQEIAPTSEQTLNSTNIPSYSLNQNQKVNHIEMMPLTELIGILKLRGVNRIIQIDSHSPAFAYHGLREGVHVVDLSAIPLMLNSACENDLLPKSETYVPVVGDDGAREMGLLGKDFLKQYGYQCQNLLQGTKRKTLTSKEIYFDHRKLAQIRGKVAVIFEDIISTGGTMLKTYHLLMKAGAKYVIILATHPIFAKNALDNLDQPNLFIVTTDSRLPLKDISEASNVIQTPLMPLLSSVADFDQKNGDYWSKAGQCFLEGNGLALAPWQTHYFSED